jgi:hypothetical protein
MWQRGNVAKWQDKKRKKEKKTEQYLTRITNQKNSNFLPTQI